MNTASLLRQNFNENGYAIIKNAFTEEEIDKIRSAKYHSFLKKLININGDLSTIQISLD